MPKWICQLNNSPDRCFIYKIILKSVEIPIELIITKETGFVNLFIVLLKLINNRTNQEYTRETLYNGVLNNYDNTPYNFGCGNYFKQVDDTHYFFGDYSLGNAGLLETVKHTDEEILTFVENNKDSFTSLKKDGKLSDMVFYFNMLNQNRYKVWDLTEHCNFLMYNVDVFKWY